MAQGWSYDYAMLARLWFVAALVHSESLEDHEKALELGNGVRSDVEKHVGKTDPNSSTEEEDLQDLYGYPNVIIHAPVHDGAQSDDFFFWAMRLFRVHYPLVKKFRHYPYRNGAVGRDSTEEEIQYAKDTDGFAMLQDEGAVNKLREDVEGGRWTPLQDEHI